MEKGEGDEERDESQGESESKGIYENGTHRDDPRRTQTQTWLWWWRVQWVVINPSMVMNEPLLRSESENCRHRVIMESR